MSEPARVPDALIEQCATGLLRRTRQRLEEQSRRAVALRERALAAARQIARRYGARRIWLFGSLAWGEAHSGSDVDLLVEGLASAEWSAATACAEEICGVPVDLVRVEEAPASLAERVRTEGILLHEPE